jgi:hypothetical protein
MKKYQKDKDFFKKELSENATPDMMEGYDLALAKQKLGKLADDDEVFKQEEDTGAGMGMNELLDKLSDDVDDSAFAGEEQQPKKKIKRKVKRKKVKRKIPKKANKAPPKKG